MNKEKITDFYVAFVNGLRPTIALGGNASLQQKSDQSQAALGWAGASLASALERDANIVFTDNKDHSQEKENRAVQDQLAIIGAATTMLPVKMSALAVRIVEFCQNFKADFEPLSQKIQQHITNPAANMTAQPSMVASGIQNHQEKPAFSLTPAKVIKMESAASFNKLEKALKRKRNFPKMRRIVDHSDSESLDLTEVEGISAADEIGENLMGMVDGMFEATEMAASRENSISFSINEKLTEPSETEEESHQPRTFN